MAKTKLHEIPVPIDQASAFAAALLDLLGGEVFDRQDKPRLVYRDGLMIVPDDWFEAAQVIEIGDQKAKGDE